MSGWVCGSGQDSFAMQAAVVHAWWWDVVGTRSSWQTDGFTVKPFSSEVAMFLRQWEISLNKNLPWTWRWFCIKFFRHSTKEKKGRKMYKLLLGRKCCLSWWPSRFTKKCAGLLEMLDKYQSMPKQFLIWSDFSSELTVVVLKYT